LRVDKIVAMQKRSVSMGLRAVVLCYFLAGVFAGLVAIAQTASRQSTTQTTTASAVDDTTAEADARAELQTGTELTRRGSLREAIPYLLAAQKAGADPYATAVNLGICYVGTNSYQQAIAVLEALRGSGRGTPDVSNLLTQAYLGNGQTDLALKVFLEAAAATPKNEELYAFIADACTDHQDYPLGLHIVELGLLQLPDSARLHYERAVFLGRLGRFDEAKPEFDRAAQLAPDSYIGYLALVQKDLYEDNLPGATQVLRQAIKSGHSDYQMLSLLGSVLLHDGAAPGQPEFAEAQTALEESAKERLDYSATQIALGQLYLRAGRYNDAVVHLEIGRTLEPNNAAVYAGLANAYGKLGDRDKARQMEEQITRLLAEKKSAPIQPHP
jgi:tetratricopeptide (TPR) repeat protein